MIDRTHPDTQDRNRRRLLFLAAMLLGASLPLAAQTPSVETEATTGLFTLPRGHSAVVYLADVGERDAAPTQVTIELIAGDNSVIRRVSGEIRPGRPLRLTAPGPDSGAISFRARATLRTPQSNLVSAPMLTLEVFNQQTFDAFANATCQLKYDPEGTGGKVLGNCGGCHIEVTFDL
jgi:hypothetical protein